MLRNYLKIAFRNLARNKTYSFINIFGLGLGLATGFILLLFVSNEYNMNGYHKNANRIFQVMGKINFGESTDVWENVPGPIAVYSRQNLPDVEKITRFRLQSDQQPVQYGNQVFLEDKYGYADNEFFKVFDFPVLEGDPQQPFTKGLSAVLTESTAKKFFGSEDPIGKQLVFRDTTCFISAVVKDVPANSSIHFDMLFSIDLVKAKFRGNGQWKTIDDDWGNYNYSTFFLLRKGGSVQNVTAALTKALKKAVPESGLTEFTARPLKNIYLYKPDGTKGRLIMVEIFFIVAVFVLLIAAINYVNLVTAKATQRMKEIGIRKIVGAERKQLFFQFFTETGVLLFLASAVAFLFVKLFLPLYQQVSGNTLYADAGNGEMWKMIAYISLGIWTITGSYPAFLLSSFNTVRSLKNEGGLSRIGVFRKSLVVLQFVVSITLLLSTVFIHRQMSYVQDRDLNLSTGQVLEIPVWKLKDAQIFRNEIANLPGVRDVTSSSSLLFEGTNSTGDIDWTNKPKDLSLMISTFDVDKNFLPFFNIKLNAGTDFRNSSENSSDYILNETAVKKMGLHDPVGQTIKLHDKPGTVIGVVRDFNFESLHNEIGPVIMQYDPGYPTALYAHVQPEQTQQFLTRAQSLWKQFNSKLPMEYHFLDDQIALQYDKENRAKRLFDAFTFITLLISCLGLFGLATHNAERRVKEIGIRKVLGATVSHITALLSKDFLLLLLISIIIAIPIVYMGMSKLLQQFAYRISLQWWVFCLGCLAAIAVAMITVGIQTVRAAKLNPVKNLRSE